MNGNRCNICGQKTSLITVTMCPECLKRHFVMCMICGHYVHKHFTTKTDTNQYICNNCLRNTNVEQCIHCGKIILDTGNLSEIVDDVVCKECFNEWYIECEICGKYIYEERVRVIKDIGSVCSDCYCKHAEICEFCGFAYGKENLFYDEENGWYVCDGCFGYYYEICLKCGELFYKRDMIKTKNGKYVCQKCYSELD